MAQKLYQVHKGDDADLGAVTVTSLTINGTALLATSVLLDALAVIDMNGNADALVLDADADTTISAPTDNQIDIEIASADDFRFTANTFTALSGSTIATNTIAETTAASGVTIDGMLVKDGGYVVGSGNADLNGTEFIIDADADTTLTADTDDQIDIKISGADDFQFTANTFTALSGSTIATNTIAETTADSGVTIDGVLVKDTAVLGRTHILAVTADGAIAVPAYNVTYFITKAGVAAMTIVDPTSTTHDGVTLTFVATTANAHTLSNAAGSGFFSSGGATKDVATFGGAIGDGLTIIAYQGKWYIDPRGYTNITLG